MANPPFLADAKRQLPRGRLSLESIWMGRGSKDVRVFRIACKRWTEIYSVILQCLSTAAELERPHA